MAHSGWSSLPNGMVFRLPCISFGINESNVCMLDVNGFFFAISENNIQSEMKEIIENELIIFNSLAMRSKNLSNLVSSFILFYL